MKKTKVLATLLVCLALVASIVACGNANNDAFTTWSDNNSQRIIDAGNAYTAKIDEARALEATDPLGSAKMTRDAINTVLGVYQPALNSLEALNINEMTGEHKSQAEEMRNTLRSGISDIQGKLTETEGKIAELEAAEAEAEYEDEYEEYYDEGDEYEEDYDEYDEDYDEGYDEGDMDVEDLFYELQETAGGAMIGVMDDEYVVIVMGEELAAVAGPGFVVIGEYEMDDEDMYIYGFDGSEIALECIETDGEGWAIYAIDGEAVEFEEADPDDALGILAEYLGLA